MSDKTIGFEGNEDELLSFQVSDETLETAAGVGSKRPAPTRFPFAPV